MCRERREEPALTGKCHAAVLIGADVDTEQLEAGFPVLFQGRRNGAGNVRGARRRWGRLVDARLQNLLLVSEIVRFDERENPFTFGSGQNCSPCINTPISLPETSVTNTTSGTYPTLAAVGGSIDFGGWMYLNLNNGGSATSGYTVTRPGNVILTGAATSNLAPAGATTTFGPRPSQNWVVIEMFGNAGGGNRLTVDFDAAWLGNGCSPAAFLSTVVPIGPAGGVPVCPPNGGACVGNAAYTGTNTTPLP